MAILGGLWLEVVLNLDGIVFVFLISFILDQQR